MVIKAAIIPAAGMGTRMLPYTKEIPKEMLPVAVRINGGNFEFKPVLHFIFDALYEVGVRYFYFIVGKGKRVIEDYFTPDWNFLDNLMAVGKSNLAIRLKTFYERIEKCNLVMINQPSPKGFGDAILKAKPFMVFEKFFVHVGDDIIYPNHSENLLLMINHMINHNVDCVMLYEEVDNPEMYGVIIGDRSDGYIDVKSVVEKPKAPPSNNAVVGVYLFTSNLFEALEKTKPKRGEHQLADALNFLLKNGKHLHALKVKGYRIDLGMPSHYLKALKIFSKNLG